ncbi:hydrogenase accessory protein HypB [Desulfitobacterium dichloroeliminans LMG P-21439]|uniref:Hydrogenase accessory protein HypB n=1 Tax=Desulfitobacterium dichloroeliminans (strain LMG P-21439 / DCA1) TaxID=871963 RepID=L0F6H7_DESDL|nr:hydrogenase nickel incorporation protein HypB [Desulfitobacterium dichloroeliminans]AGA68261.1 hydrogenase accessory protein HypB [Desulfitobacterium dichloroeliminans LMG P-21439]
MNEIRVIEIKKSIHESNNLQADELRSILHKKHTFLLNLMSSPGSGKTSLVMRTIEKLDKDLKIGVIEADIDSTVDAEKIIEAGVPAVQLHTGGMCHIDATMTETGLEALDVDNLDLIILENVGNLVCPAEFDTGASKSAMILSVPEGHDKPLKYPLMFSMVDVLIISKIDCLPYFDFDVRAVKESVKKLNPNIEIFETSAKTGEGFDQWADWLRKEALAWQQD